MISIQDKINCCGCNACADICKSGAIKFETDFEGFWYPAIDADKCVDCGLCNIICPNENDRFNPESLSRSKVYAAYSKDNFIRLDSTSGGIYSTLALEFLKRNAYISGAVFNSDYTCSHIVSNNKEDLPRIRSSKYLQSSMAGLYNEIKNILKKNESVLFCGTPCHVQALYNFLGREYENLVTVDFICRGVNSPKVFQAYLSMLKQKYNSNIVGVKFKNKKWGWHNFSLKVDFANGKTYCKDRYHDLFFRGYLSYGNFARPSCYDCKFKGVSHKSDITLADFWGIEKLDPKMDQDKGTSLVIINSTKGLELFEVIQRDIEFKEFSINDAIAENPALVSSLQVSNNNRTDFFNAINYLPFNQVADMFFPRPSIFKRIQTKICRLIRF